MMSAAGRYREIEFRRRKIAFIENSLLRGLPWWRWRRRQFLRGWIAHYQRHIADFEAMPIWSQAEDDERRRRYREWLVRERGFRT
jgi:hypothetical protein